MQQNGNKLCLLNYPHATEKSCLSWVLFAGQITSYNPSLSSICVTEYLLEVLMANSKQIGAILGPTIVAMTVAEFPLVQPHLYDAQIPPVVYLSGVLMFVGGLAIVRTHNVWARNWTVLVTLSGWFFLGLGLVRMFAAGQYRQTSADTSQAVFMVLEAILVLIGLLISFQSYRRGNS
jgi:hypothetical protein